MGAEDFECRMLLGISRFPGYIRIAMSYSCRYETEKTQKQFPRKAAKSHMLVTSDWGHGLWVLARLSREVCSRASVIES